MCVCVCIKTYVGEVGGALFDFGKLPAVVLIALVGVDVVVEARRQLQRLAQRAVLGRVLLGRVLD